MVFPVRGTTAARLSTWDLWARQLRWQLGSLSKESVGTCQGTSGVQVAEKEDARCLIRINSSGTLSRRKSRLSPSMVTTREKCVRMPSGPRMVVPRRSSSSLGEEAARASLQRREWRCLAIDDLADISVLDGEWRTASNHSQPNTCIDEIDLEVDY